MTDECKFPSNAPGTAYSKGCKCGRCKAGINAAAAVSRKAGAADRAEATRISKRTGECQFPGYAPITGYNKGCRCQGCIDSMRATNDLRRAKAKKRSKRPMRGTKFGGLTDRAAASFASAESECSRQSAEGSKAAAEAALASAVKAAAAAEKAESAARQVLIMAIDIMSRANNMTQTQEEN